ncbi:MULTISPECIES: hypothetical protein [Burkholderia]|uniref:Uncharacterized protein n=2 Tax=Burkholderia contaminans TaxID=488447 RepID=A0ABD7YBG6_9BURK|nr:MULTISPECIES: hypothetical protein [Burkholderia]UTP27591.1 hypothetical protein NMB33_36145 [Burkholderia sp. FXe9]KKL42318.1 hypothetical protein WR31_10210 [Burkholderia contaminans LMG 23361]MCA7905783.1 hypothetical protein [Burkholderia contaminans]MCA8186493.1 hypothetical protein [Burkholderia contaminans]MCA8369699.1 hypothetical protein [Burkholderia contaminans]
MTGTAGAVAGTFPALSVALNGGTAAGAVGGVTNAAGALISGGATIAKAAVQSVGSAVGSVAGVVPALAVSLNGNSAQGGGSASGGLLAPVTSLVTALTVPVIKK